MTRISIHKPAASYAMHISVTIYYYIVTSGIKCFTRYPHSLFTIHIHITIHKIQSTTPSLFACCKYLSNKQREMKCKNTGLCILCKNIYYHLFSSFPTTDQSFQLLQISQEVLPDLNMPSSASYTPIIRQ